MPLFCTSAALSPAMPVGSEDGGVTFPSVPVELDPPPPGGKHTFMYCVEITCTYVHVF